MKFDFVFILPLIAAALVVFYPLLDRNSDPTKSFRSRRRRKILLGRLTVIVLLIATLVGPMLPIAELGNLSKALLVCAVVLVPAFLIHFYMMRRSANLPKDMGIHTHSGSRPSRIVKNKIPVNKQLSANHDQIQQTKTTKANLPVIDLIADTGTATNTVEESRRAAEAFNTPESPVEVQEQLNRTSDLVESHDLGHSDYSLSDNELQQNRVSLNSDAPLSVDSTLATVNQSANELSNMSTNQVSELVVSLRTDKTRLQKLVIAQQSAIDSERKAHDQSRTVARDAIKIMRDARNGQKLAEKMARRERSERKRVAQEYKKVAHALNNALSIIDTRKTENAQA